MAPLETPQAQRAAVSFPVLVLASASPARRALLSRILPQHHAIAHAVDERAMEASLGPVSLEELAMTLADAKARSIADALAQREHPLSGAHVLGGDQLVDLRGEVLGKPGNDAGARAQLARLAGKEHRLLTAVALIAPDGRTYRHLDIHLMRMRPLSPEAIARYVGADQPFDCCGAYRIESRGVALFDRVRGKDPTAIEGLPLMTVARLLEAEDFTLYAE